MLLNRGFSSWRPNLMLPYLENPMYRRKTTQTFWTFARREEGSSRGKRERVSRSGNETEGERRKPRNKTVRSESSDAAGVLRSHAGVHVVKAAHALRESARGERRARERGWASRVGRRSRDRGDASIAIAPMASDRARASGIARSRRGEARDARAVSVRESEQITVFVFGRETHEGGDVEPGEVLGDPGGLPLAGLGVEFRG